MKKELMVSGIVVFLLILLFSGCTEQAATKEKKEPQLPQNEPPVIQDCHTEYFDRNDSATIFFVGVASDDDGTVVLYSWNLSDGFISNDQSFIHTFSHPGYYQARLTVMDDKGATNTTTIPVYVYETPYENEQRDGQRVIGRWENNEGTIVEFTSNGEYITVKDQVYSRYWFSAGELFIHFSKNNETLRYEYSFQTDNTLLISSSGHSPTAQDTWVRIH